MTGTAVVVGAGVNGLAVACALADRGWRVRLVEQGQAAHPAGASRTPTRYLRWAHGANARYTAMVSRSLEHWRALERATGEQVFLPLGVAWIVPADDPWVAASTRTLADAGIAHRLVGPEDAAGVLPGVALGDDERLLVEEDAGLLRAELALRLLAERAARRGVERIAARAEPDAAAVVAGGRRLEADAVVWAAGAWLPRLFPGVVRARVTKQDVLYLDAPPAWDGVRVPAWIDYGTGMYGTPDVGGHGVKLARDLPGRTVADPDADGAPGDAGAERDCRAAFRRRFPGLPDGGLRRVELCHYALTPDGEWIVAPHPEHDRVWLIGGDSGHAFKHGLLVGELVAACVTDGTDPDPAWGLAPRSARAQGVRTAAGDAR